MRKFVLDHLFQRFSSSASSSLGYDLRQAYIVLFTYTSIIVAVVVTNFIHCSQFDSIQFNYLLSENKNFKINVLCFYFINRFNDLVDREWFGLPRGKMYGFLRCVCMCAFQCLKNEKDNLSLSIMFRQFQFQFKWI